MRPASSPSSPRLGPLLFPFGSLGLLDRFHVIQLGLDLRADLKLSARRLGVISTSSLQEQSAEPKRADGDKTDQDFSRVQDSTPPASGQHASAEIGARDARRGDSIEER
jgi:hypothetical protein